MGHSHRRIAKEAAATLARQGTAPKARADPQNNRVQQRSPPTIGARLSRRRGTRCRSNASPTRDGNANSDFEGIPGATQVAMPGFVATVPSSPRRHQRRRERTSEPVPTENARCTHSTPPGSETRRPCRSAESEPPQSLRAKNGRAGTWVGADIRSNAVSATLNRNKTGRS